MHHRSNLSDLSWIVLFESVHGQDHVHLVRLGRRWRWRAADTYDVHNGGRLGLGMKMIIMMHKVPFGLSWAYSSASVTPSANLPGADGDA